MGGSSAWWVLLLALLAANWPFVSQRVLLIWARPKTTPIRLLELVLLYFVVAAISLSLEQRQGQIYPQGWEFYAVTVFLYLTLAFPGFVYRYLWRHK
jgi:hypothetical protein